MEQHRATGGVWIELRRIFPFVESNPIQIQTNMRRIPSYFGLECFGNRATWSQWNRVDFYGSLAFVDDSYSPMSVLFPNWRDRNYQRASTSTGTKPDFVGVSFDSSSSFLVKKRQNWYRTLLEICVCDPISNILTRQFGKNSGIGELGWKFVFLKFQFFLEMILIIFL